MVSKLNNDSEKNILYVLDETIQQEHQKTINKIVAEIYKLVDYYTLHHKEDLNKIDLHIIREFWSELNKNYIDIFANVNYGYSTTVHKSQSSTYQNVFVDLDDIVRNKNQSDMMRCLYTAITRASERLYILI